MNAAIATTTITTATVATIEIGGIGPGRAIETGRGVIGAVEITASGIEMDGNIESLEGMREVVIALRLGTGMESGEEGERTGLGVIRRGVVVRGGRAGDRVRGR